MSSSWRSWWTLGLAAGASCRWTLCTAAQQHIQHVEQGLNCFAACCCIMSQLMPSWCAATTQGRCLMHNMLLQVADRLQVTLPLTMSAAD
jgi:hypothetical protein